MQPVVNYDHKTIQVRRGTTTEWRRYGAICVPAEGEICVEFFQDADGTRNGNTGMKVGNGTSNYTDLPYLVTNQSQDDRISDEQINNWDLTVEKLANLTAAEIAQDNASLGDNVQEALNDLHTRLLSIDPDGGSIEINDISGLEDALKDKADKDHTHDEYLTDAPNNGKQYVRQSEAWAEVTISGGGAPAWDDVTGKPADYPPSAHDHAWDSITGKPADYPPSVHEHEIADVNGLQDALNAAGGTPGWDDVTGKPTEFPPAAHNQDWSTITNTPSDYPPSAHDHAWDDVTGKPTEFPPEAHTHEQSEVDGLELRLEAIEGSISSGGGFVDAPNDGQLYGRQSEAWAVVPAGGAGSWDDLTGKPAEFPPEAHSQDWSTITNTPADFPPSTHGHAWDEVTGKPTEFPPEAHTQGWDTITSKPADFPPSAHGHAWGEITGKPSEFPPASHNHDGVYQPVGDYIEDANSDGKLYGRKDGAWSEVVIPDGGSGGGGAGILMSDTEPADKTEGMMWMDTSTSPAVVWVWDGAAWVEFPFVGSSPKLAAPIPKIEYLVVAGGGAGQAGDKGAGGGAGGYRTNVTGDLSGGSSTAETTPAELLNVPLWTQFIVKVGEGGFTRTGNDSDASNTEKKGQNSSFGPVVSTGGGRGGSGNGGSGGGATGSQGDSSDKSGGTAVAGQGTDGGPKQNNNTGGGGGAGGGGAGTTEVLNGSARDGNHGGAGLVSSIDGLNKARGGGGGGSSTTARIPGDGGNGGGGQGGMTGVNSPAIMPTAGEANTGGGGGGGSSSSSSYDHNLNTGGSGIVIVRYQGPQWATGGVVTTHNGYTVHTFTSGEAIFNVTGPMP